MVRERVTIDIQAIDGMSKVLQHIRQNMEKAKSDIVRFTQQMNRFAAQGDVMQAGRYRAAIERRMELLRQLSSQYKKYERVINEVQGRQREELPLMQRIAERSRKMSRSFRRAASNMVWASLSMLGVNWSLQSLLASTVDPIRQNVNALSDYANAAFRVATWLSIARREGVDVSAILGDKSISDFSKDMVDVSLLLKATFGSLQELMLAFFTRVIKSTPKLEKSIKETFEVIAATFSDPKLIDKMGEFMDGLLTGVKALITHLPDLIDVFDKLIGFIMDLAAGFVSTFQGFGVPAIKAVADEILDAKSGVEKFGIAMGGLAALSPVLTPLITLFQSLFSVIQVAVFAVFGLLDALGALAGFGGKGGILEDILGVGGASKARAAWDAFKSKVLSAMYAGFKGFIDRIAGDNALLRKLGSLITRVFKEAIMAAIDSLRARLGFAGGKGGLGGKLGTFLVPFAGTIPYLANIVGQRLFPQQFANNNITQYQYFYIQSESDWRETERRLSESTRYAVYRGVSLG